MTGALPSSARIAAVLLMFILSIPSAAADLQDSTTQEFYPEERDALIQFRDSIQSGDFNLHGNWTGPPCYQNRSRWAGIACTNSHVTHLVLEGITLAGSLQASFFRNITFLSKLSLRNNSLHGPLPDFTNLARLEFVFLSRNNFSGPIPPGYARDLPVLSGMELQENSLDGAIPAFDQPTLKAFNVSYNRLQGPIPKTPVLRSFSASSFQNNSGLCGSPLDVLCPPVPNPVSPPSPGAGSPPPANRNKGPLTVWSIILIAAAATLVPISVVLIFLCYYRGGAYVREKKRRESAGEEETSGREISDKKGYWSEGPQRTTDLEFFNKDKAVFDMEDLLRSSAEVMGRGRLGTVYKATLDSGPVVTVKRLREMNDLSKKEFVQQMQLLGQLRHPNLVEIISFYYSKEEKLIISEYVPDGNLFQLLHGTRGIGREPLNWEARFAIIKDVAKGLSFLHQSLPSHKVPHGNIRSTNVLLILQPHDHQLHSGDEKQHSRKSIIHRCKLVDYGFLPLVPSYSNKLAVAETPEFFQGKKLSGKADIYCFGILLLEIITGKIPGETDHAHDDHNKTGPHEHDLSHWARAVVNNDWSTDILDIEIVAEKDGYEEMLKLTKLALECTDPAPEKRPKMSEVMRRIEEIELESQS